MSIDAPPAIVRFADNHSVATLYGDKRREETLLGQAMTAVWEICKREEFESALAVTDFIDQISSTVIFVSSVGEIVFNRTFATCTIQQVSCIKDRYTKPIDKWPVTTHFEAEVFAYLDIASAVLDYQHLGPEHYQASVALLEQAAKSCYNWLACGDRKPRAVVRREKKK